MLKAYKDGQSLNAKAHLVAKEYTVDSLLPAQPDPNVVPQTAASTQVEFPTTRAEPGLRQEGRRHQVEEGCHDVDHDVASGVRVE